MKKLTCLLIKSIDFNYVDINAEDTIRDIVSKLTTEYGQIIGNSHERKDELGHELYFDPNLNPLATLKWLDQQQSLLSQSGAPISFDEYRRIVKRGISHEDDHLKTAPKFWLEFRRILMECHSVAGIRTKMVEYWVLNQGSSVVKKETGKTKAAEPVKPGPYGARKDTANLTTYGGKHCSECAQAGRYRIADTHNDDKCFYKHGFPNKGFKGLSGKGKRKGGLAAQVEELGEKFEALMAVLSANKADDNYFHDTGCTPVSFVETKPINFFPKLGKVSTAGTQVIKTFGSGTIKFGSLELPAVHASSLAKNLVSGIAINKLGFHQTIANNRLVVTNKPLASTDATIVATGKIDNQSGLIRMDPVTDPKASSIVLKNRFAALMTHEACEDDCVEKESRTPKGSEIRPEKVSTTST